MTDAIVTLYVDYRSPYSYLAKEDAYRLEDDFRVMIDWYPYQVDLQGVYGAVEQRTEAEWRKVRYLYMDVRRLANKRGLTIKGTRRIYDPTLASGDAVRQEPGRAATVPRYSSREVLDTRDGD
jgi:2-hydroxychromene-2-carboxylate isomerase